METNRIDVMFVQETHNTTDNESDWKRAFKGEVVLSLNYSLSGGVGILFVQSYLPFSFTVSFTLLLLMIPGVLLKVKAVFENVKLVFLNVYTPTNAADRVAFLNILSDCDKNCEDDGFMFLGGDFSCTEKSTLDRNHPEPHPPSSHTLRQLMENQELSDEWRVFNSQHRQYTWSHCREGVLSLARLDHFYCFKHHFNIFKRCCIQPVGFSDHFLVSCHVFIKNISLKNAYWHFNTALLDGF